MGNVLYRSLQPKDDEALAKIIFRSLEEYELALPGTVYTDPETKHLSRTFITEKNAYFIAEVDGVVAGGAGIYQTNDLPEHTAELVKMYIGKSYRKQGIGTELINLCIEFAKEKGYRYLYLESFPVLKDAIRLYESLGFTKTGIRLGSSGHFTCDVFMIKEL